MGVLVCPFNSFKPCSYDCMAYLGSRKVPIRKDECSLLIANSSSIESIATELHNIDYTLETINSIDVSISGDLTTFNHNEG